MEFIDYEQQIALHLQFLQQAGFDSIENLVIDSPEFIRSRAYSKAGRGEYVYKTVSRKLNSGKTGLMTWCRGVNGRIQIYKTYGNPPRWDGQSAIFPRRSPMMNCPTLTEKHAEVNVKKIQHFWELSSPQGESDYLKRKGVGALSLYTNSHIPLKSTLCKLRCEHVTPGRIQDPPNLSPPL